MLHMNHTVIRNLNSSGYKYFQLRKNGLMTHKDTKLHLAYFKDIKKKKLGQDFWCNDIAFYFNGVGFKFKTNPLDRVRTASKRIAETNRLGHQLCREREKRGVRQCQIHGWHFTWKECIFLQAIFWCDQWPGVQKYYALHVQVSIHRKWPRRQMRFKESLPLSERSSSPSILGPNGMWVGKHTVKVSWS